MMGKHLTFEQRKKLEQMYSAHVRVRDIAENLACQFPRYTMSYIAGQWMVSTPLI